MKLIFCTSCRDIVKLDLFQRTCECGGAWGHYRRDGLRAVVGGSAIPLGFRNDEFVAALRNRPAEGLGSPFAAFVIPHACDTVEHLG